MKLNIQLFAASGSISCAQIGDYDIANNTTVERITFTVKRTSGTTFWSDLKTVTFIVNGQTYTSSLALKGSQSSSSCYVDVTVPHEADGSKYLEYSASIVTGTSAGTIRASGNKWLTKIPRAISLTLSNANPIVGDTLRITLNKSADVFTGSLSYKPPNSDTYYFLAKNISDFYDWTLPQNLLQYFTDSPSGTFTIRCDTYNGLEDSSNYVGTSYASFSLNLRPNVDAPNFDLSIAEANNIVSSLGIGAYVQNQSKIKISFNNIVKCQNSPLHSVYILLKDSTGKTVWNKVQEVEGNATDVEITTDTISISGQFTVIATVYDKRHAATIEKVATSSALAYESPKITSVSAVRSTSSGSESESGTYLKYVFQASITSLNDKNTKKYEIGYKTTGSSTYTYKSISTSSYELNASGVLTGATLNANYVYDIRFRVTDAFNEVYIDRELGADFKLINFNASGHSMAFGTISNRSSNEKYIDSELTINCMNGLEIDGVDINTIIANTLKKYTAGMSLYLNDSTSITMTPWQLQNVPLNAVFYDNGLTYLKKTNEYIEITSDEVHAVEVSAEFTLWYEDGPAGKAVEIHVLKNSIEAGISSYVNRASGNATQTFSIGSFPLSVEKGDKISLGALQGVDGPLMLYGTTTRPACSLYVKVIN